MDLIDHNEVTREVNQIETHPFFQRQDYQQLLGARGVQLESWGPFAEGRNNLFSDPTLSQIGAAHHKSVAQVVLRWLIQRQVAAIPQSPSGQSGWRRNLMSSTSSSPTRRWVASPRWTPAPRCSSTTATRDGRPDRQRPRNLIGLRRRLGAVVRDHRCCVRLLKVGGSFGARFNRDSRTEVASVFPWCPWLTR